MWDSEVANSKTEIYLTKHIILSCDMVDIDTEGGYFIEKMIFFMIWCS